jgi:hypothetical protein
VVHKVAQGEYVRLRGHPVNGYGEGREDRAPLLWRHGAAPRELQQGRSVEARQHDAEAPVQRHLAEHLRRRGAGGEGGAGHSRLVPGGPLRSAGLEQLHDLTGGPGVDVSEGAFADLLPQGSPHRSSSAAGSNHRRRVDQGGDRPALPTRSRSATLRGLRPIARTVQRIRCLRFRAGEYKHPSTRPQRSQRRILDQLSISVPQLRSESHAENGRHRCS